MFTKFCVASGPAGGGRRATRNACAAATWPTAVGCGAVSWDRSRWLEMMGALDPGGLAGCAT